MGKYIGDAERAFIENKYHRVDEPFDPFDRFPYHGFLCDPATGLDDDGMREGLERLYGEIRGENHALAKAKGFAFVLDHMRIGFDGRDFFPAFYNWGRPLQKPFVDRWRKEAFDGIPETRDLMRDYMDSGTADMWLDTEHVVPNWGDIFALGFPGLLARVKRYRAAHERNGNRDAAVFLTAIETEYEAILRLICRFRDYAKGIPGERAERFAASMERLSVGLPQDFFDALQLIYFYFMCSESVDQYQVRSLGNGLDRTLYPFYRDDLAAGRYSEGQIGEVLAAFLLQFHAIGNYWGQPFYLTGTAEDGTDISALSHLILDVYGSLEILNPKIQFKLDENTPPDLLRHVLRLIRAGHTSFVICCVPGMVQSLMGCYGVTEEEARNCDISGCNEMHIRANEACMISSLPNAAKAINYVFSDGYDVVTGKQLGLHTGNVEEFKTFAEFYDAFLRQFRYILDNAIGMARKYEPFAAVINPSVMLSAAIENSLASGKDGYTFAVKYPTSSLLLCSFATAVDSVLAVRELVFEGKVTTLSEMKKALDANWEGYEPLRRQALKARHKYGNGDPIADRYAAAIYRWFSTYVTGQKNSRGGVYKVGVPSTLHFISQGKQTAATPDGRKMGEECSKNVAPVIGMERNGALGMIRSALSLPPWLFSEAFVLDVMLHPSAVSGEDGLKAMEDVVTTYMREGGISIQFNIFSPEMLRDAQEHPEKYKNLEVRVSGWNVLWNDLSKEEQDAYILRAESLQ